MTKKKWWLRTLSLTIDSFPDNCRSLSATSAIRYLQSVRLRHLQTYSQIRQTRHQLECSRTTRRSTDGVAFVRSFASLCRVLLKASGFSRHTDHLRLHLWTRHLRQTRLRTTARKNSVYRCEPQAAFPNLISSAPGDRFRCSCLVASDSSASGASR